MRGEQGLVGRAAITIMILIVVGGIATVDGASVVFATLKASDVADAAAAAGAEAWGSTHDARQAQQAAVDSAKTQDPSVKVTAVTVDRDGTVTVSVKKKASTLIVQRVGFLRHLGVVHQTSTAAP